MTWVSAGYTHGGPHFYKKVLEAALANGWSRVEDVEDRGQLAAQSVAMRNTVPVDIDLTGKSVGVWYELPLVFLGSFSAYKNFVTPVAEGVDFDVSRVRGQYRLRAGGQFDNGIGGGTGRFTLAQGYELRSGWTVIGSPGVSGTEGLLVGLRLESLSGNPDNPIRCGVRWSIFRSWVVGSTNYFVNDTTVRNAAADDVRQLIHPTTDFVVEGSFNADRIVAYGRARGYGAWCYAGALTRFRPQVEQDSVAALMGNQGYARNGDDGPVGATHQKGTAGLSEGAVWLHDLGVFSSTVNPADLNANYWSFDAGATVSVAYTPSRRLLNVPGVSGTPQYYFELHDAVAGRNNDALNSTSNVLYGLWGGIKACLVFDAINGLDLTYDGRTYRLLGVGSSTTRFVAAEKI